MIPANQLEALLESSANAPVLSGLGVKFVVKFDVKFGVKFAIQTYAKFGVKFNSPLLMVQPGAGALCFT